MAIDISHTPAADSYFYVDPPHYLKCAICTEVMKNPVSLSCGHSFCHQCAQKAISRKRECPICRKEPSHMHPNISLCQALDEQFVNCRFGPKRPDFTERKVFEKNVEGCSQMVRRCDAPTHEKECSFRWVLCGLVDHTDAEALGEGMEASVNQSSVTSAQVESQEINAETHSASFTRQSSQPNIRPPPTTCETLCRFEELALHQAECEFRMTTCPNEGCGHRVTIRSMGQHREHCLFEFTTCPNEGCKESLLRSDLAAHRQSCPFKVVTCPFDVYGCTEEGTQGSMDLHMAKASNDHLVMLSRAVGELTKNLAKEKRINGGSKKFHVMIHQFDKLVKKQVIDIHLDTCWKLKIWPNGEDKRHKGYVSIRLFSREAQPDFKVEGPYTLRILNRTTPDQSIVKMTEATTREWADSVRGWGFPAFAKVEDILDPSVGFLRDGCLSVEVEVKVLTITETVEYWHSEVTDTAGQGQGPAVVPVQKCRPPEIVADLTGNSQNQSPPPAPTAPPVAPEFAPAAAPSSGGGGGGGGGAPATNPPAGHNGGCEAEMDQPPMATWS